MRETRSPRPNVANAIRTKSHSLDTADSDLPLPSGTYLISGSYVVVYGGVQCTVVCGSRWCAVVYGGVRWCMVVYGGVWGCMVVCGGVRRCAVVYGGLRWCAVVYGGVMFNMSDHT